MSGSSDENEAQDSMESANRGAEMADPTPAELIEKTKEAARKGME